MSQDCSELGLIGVGLGWGWSRFEALVRVDFWCNLSEVGRSRVGNELELFVCKMTRSATVWQVQGWIVSAMALVQPARRELN
jgi:hypothetical protein